MFLLLASVTAAQNTPSLVAPPATQPAVIATPAEALTQMAAALSAGDVARVSQLLPEPARGLYAGMYQSLLQVGVAKQRLIKSLDQKFPEATDSLAFVPDDAGVRQNVQLIRNLFLLDEREDFDRQILNVTVERSISAGHGTARTEQYVAIKQDGSWHIVPLRMMRGIDLWRKHNELLQALPAELNGIADQVDGGVFANRADAVAAIQKAVAPANVPPTQSPSPLPQNAAGEVTPSPPPANLPENANDALVPQPIPAQNGGRDWSGYFQNVAVVVRRAKIAFAQANPQDAANYKGVFKFDLTSEGEVQNLRGPTAHWALDVKAAQCIKQAFAANRKVFEFPMGTNRMIQPGGPVEVNFADDSDSLGVRTQTPYIAPTPFTNESQPPGQ